MDALQAWHKSYMADTSDHLLQPSWLMENELDFEKIEREIQSAMISVNVANESCAHCQHILDNWPSSTGIMPFHEDTISLEASARKVCRLCRMLMSKLRWNDYLGQFRQFEQRLRHFNNVSTLFLWIGYWSLQLNIPGHTYPSAAKVWVSSCQGSQSKHFQAVWRG